MERFAAVALVAGVLVGGCSGPNDYSETFKSEFMSSCEQSSGGQSAYCECALDYLIENGPSEEEDITAGEMTDAASACEGEL